MSRCSTHIPCFDVDIQGGSPVNARTCKHLKSLFGEKYEEARLKLKNPDGTTPKGTAKTPPSKAKAKTQPVKRVRKPASTSKPVSKGKGKTKKEDDDDDDDGEQVDADAADSPVTSKVIPELLLANKWDLETGPDPTGWWISEKLDGVR